MSYIDNHSLSNTTENKITMQHNNKYAKHHPHNYLGGGQQVDYMKYVGVGPGGLAIPYTSGGDR